MMIVAKVDEVPWLHNVDDRRARCSDGSAADQAIAGLHGTAVLKDATGKEVGKASFTATPSGALLDLNA